MRVHLLRCNELPWNTYQNVVNTLNLFKGPISFVPSADAGQIELEDLEHDEVFFENEDEFNKIARVFYSDRASSGVAGLVPIRAIVYSWPNLFSICQEYRKSMNVSDDELVVFLTEMRNDKNWFGGISENGRDLFVHTSHWDYYFKSSIDFKYPVAYEVISWVLRSLVYETSGILLDRLHEKTLGCYMDLCKDKRDVLMKMRTADICPSCMQDIAKRDLSAAIVSQCIETMEGIRRSMTFRERFEVVNRPSRLEIRGEMKRLHLLDLGADKVPLNPKERAVYLLFLKHENGIRLVDIQDHVEELADYYRRFTRDSDTKRIEQSIQRLTNPLENNLSEVLSRIRRKFRDAVGHKMAEFYCIDGPSGSEKRISLDRSLVIGEP